MNKILVIDDDAQVRRMFRTLLQGAGHEVSKQQTEKPQSRYFKRRIRTS